MSSMSSATVIRIDSARERGRRVARAVDARRRLHDQGERRVRTRPEGRAWLNGSELGEARTALTHLAESYD
jgi:hypothetical protein